MIELIWLSKIAMSLLLSALIGIERETSDKPMGFRGTMLICFGVTVLTIIGLQFINYQNLDMTRLMYAPIVGIGFFGSGLLISRKGMVEGITTASLLFALVAIGLACGIGQFVLAIMATLSVYFILKLKLIENKIT